MTIEYLEQLVSDVVFYARELEKCIQHNEDTSYWTKRYQVAHTQLVNVMKPVINAANKQRQ